MATKAPQIPSVTYQNILRIGGLICSTIGANITNENFRNNFLTYFSVMCVVVYFAITAGTMKELLRDGWISALENSCLIGTVLQATAKFFGAIGKRRHFTNACHIVRQIFHKYERKDQQHFAALQLSMGQVKSLMRTMAFWYLSSWLGILMTPFVMLVYNGQRYALLPFVVPYIDGDTKSGYWLTLAIHLGFFVVGSFALCAGDFFVIFLIVHLAIFIKVFKLKVRILNGILETPQHSDSKAVDDTLRDLVQFHQLYIEYSKNIKEFLSIMITAQIPTAGLTMAISIFIIMTSDWPGAYTYFYYAIFNLYSYCILGTKVDNWNDELCHDVYNISWYNLKVRQQKLVRLMLMQAQTQDTLAVAGCVPLTVATGLQVTKVIYSFTMLLMKFVVK